MGVHGRRSDFGPNLENDDTRKQELRVPREIKPLRRSSPAHLERVSLHRQSSVTSSQGAEALANHRVTVLDHSLNGDGCYCGPPARPVSLLFGEALHSLGTGCSWALRRRHRLARRRGVEAGPTQGPVTALTCHQGSKEKMMAVGNLLGLLKHSAVRGAFPAPCYLHRSSWRADSNRASLTRLRRQAYARLYPVLLVKQDGSTIHVRYREPRRMLVMPLDVDALSPEERRAMLRKREAQLQQKKEEEPEMIDDNFDTEQYKRFWIKTKK